MKKHLLLVSILALGLLACNQKNENEEVIVVENGEYSTQFQDEHNAQNSLDWSGTYSGTLPCADCEGITTTITLNSNGTFSSKEDYQKKPNVIIENKGTFIWDNHGQVITVESENDDFKRYFKVVEGSIIHLDNEGNEITGELAPMYRLSKQ